ncbi:ADL034Wp [Eremothecium gossypii ATCC 10895]|uniref:ADL034Wp n=1 Tax=Eremothecium gossypii (strain ATCC 10895 / CBS 109.51 / FGSC 9923 / NRRL Y-1056) TaxID=284811 RepID=Q75AF1_EREGS|nr:ADL034Wp [Eremothecium gossypii ATCC 10895]AAS51887.1 ADL034Wp [Eremothecium gossypii ATCC 10895]AEY96186.1 FADL034Wp [Eremothecium gossypii FDAG1]
MAPELPGFYYDSARGRYFRVAAAGAPAGAERYGRDELRRKRAHNSDNLRRQQEAARAEQARRELVLALARGRAGDLRRIAGAPAPPTTGRVREHLDVFRERPPATLLPQMFYEDGVFLLMDQRAVLYAVRDADGSVSTAAPAAGFGAGEAAGPVLDEQGGLGGWLLRAHGAYSLAAPDGTLRDTALPRGGEVFAALALGDEAFFAQHARVLRAPAGARRLPRSADTDVLALAVAPHGAALFAGCRNGQLFRLPPAPHAPPELIHTFPGPVVGLRPLPGTPLLVASVHAHPAQLLCVLDTRGPARQPVVRRLATRLRNAAAATEILQLAGSLLLYGSTAARDGRGDWDLFCLDPLAHHAADYDPACGAPSVLPAMTMDQCLAPCSRRRLLAAALCPRLHAADADGLFHAACSAHQTQFYRETDTQQPRMRVAMLCRDADEVGLVLRSTDL